MIRFLILFCAFIPVIAQAQFGDICVDSNRINPYYACNDPSFYPTCGCDGVTYRNECEMRNIGGVNYASRFENGVCQNDFFYYFIYPNPTRNTLNFNMQFADQQSTLATLQIFNVFGEITYSLLLNNIGSLPYHNSIDLTGLETGVYTLVVQANGVYKISKFIKHN